MEFGIFKPKNHNVQAIRYTDANAELTQAYPRWFIEALAGGTIYQTEVDGVEALVAKTGFGTVVCKPDQWLVREGPNKFTVFDDAEFRKCYTEAKHE